MLLYSTEQIPGRQIIESYGMVSGSTVRTKNVVRDIGAGIKGIVGGKMKAYSALLDRTRAEAVENMLAEAHRLGGNAIVAVRFATSDIAPGSAEVFVWGTAVLADDTDAQQLGSASSDESETAPAEKEDATNADSGISTDDKDSEDAEEN